MATNRFLLNIVNALLFQLGWFICVLSGSMKAAVFTITALLVHFSLSSTRRADVIAVCVAVLIGVIHDALLIQLGLVRFVESSSFPPVWMMCLWVLFALTFHHSIQWIYSRPLWSGVLGALFAPVSYLAGVHLSSAEWSGPLWAIVPIIMALWLVVLPAHRLFCRRIERYVAFRFESQ